MLPIYACMRACVSEKETVSARACMVLGQMTGVGLAVNALATQRQIVLIVNLFARARTVCVYLLL